MVNLFVWYAALPPTWAAATDLARGTREYLIKAAFIYDLVKATQWPGQTSRRIVLCVRGRDPFGEAWESIQDRPVGARRLHVAHLAPTARTSGCDALFLGTSERQWWLRSRAALADEPILTISEMTGFSKDGGMVTMMNVDNRLRFDVNLQAVRAAGLGINTEALELANMIHAGTARVERP
jgi:hypothetical protein